MHQIPHSILSDSQCTPGGCTGGACACGHAAADHRRWPGCSGEACGECPCAQYDAPDRLTLTLPGLELEPRPERSLTDAELRAALADPARDVEASRELERRGVRVLETPADRDLEALRRRDLERAKVAIARERAGAAGMVPCRTCGKPTLPHPEGRAIPVACSLACFYEAEGVRP